MKRDSAVAYIRKFGPIPAVRVSSAQARGRAKKYSYWGAVRYEIRLRKRDDELTAVPVESASSDRRSFRLAEQDAARIASSEHRILITGQGTQFTAV